MFKSLKLLCILLMFTMVSCTVSKEINGNYDPSAKTEVVLKKEKELTLFWDLVKVRQADKNLGIANYEKIVKRTFFDGVIYYGTIGIVSFHTVKIKINKP